MKQRHAEMIFKRFHLVAKGCRCDVQFLGSLRKTQVARDRLEGAQGIERGKIAGHVSLDGSSRGVGGAAARRVVSHEKSSCLP